MHADLDRIRVTCEGVIVADHARVSAQHQTFTDFEHTVAAKLLCHGRRDLPRPVADAATGQGRNALRGPGPAPCTLRLPPSWL